MFREGQGAVEQGQEACFAVTGVLERSPGGGAIGQVDAVLAEGAGHLADEDAFDRSAGVSGGGSSDDAVGNSTAGAFGQHEIIHQSVRAGREFVAA